MDFGNTDWQIFKARYKRSKAEIEKDWSMWKKIIRMACHKI